MPESDPDPEAAPLLIVTDDSAAEPESWPRGAKRVAAIEYLTGAASTARAGARVLNQSTATRYLEAGYYVSLLAAARGHKVQPNYSSLEGYLAARVFTEGLRRAQAIVSGCTMDSAERQPGLFDARAERRWQARDLERRQSLAVARARVAAVSAQAEPHTSGPELALVLEPQRGESRR